MSRPVDLQLAVEGGAGRGLGHVMRAVALAQAAERRGLEVEIALRGDGSAEAVLAREAPGLPVVPWREPQDAPGRARAVVLDTRGPIESTLRAARSAGVRSVVIDRTDHLDDADWTVLPGAHAAALAHPRVVRGPEWCVIASEIAAARARGAHGGRDRVLLSLGGADPHRATLPATEAILEALGSSEAERVDVVVGPSFAEPDRLTDALDALGVLTHRAPTRAELALLALEARLAVVGFGTAVYELAYLGVPTLTLTHHASDLADAERLENLGFSKLAGMANDLHPSVLERMLLTLLDDEAWCRAASDAAQKAIGDAEGASRIVALAVPEARGGDVGREARR